MKMKKNIKVMSKFLKSRDIDEAVEELEEMGIVVRIDYGGETLHQKDWLDTCRKLGNFCVRMKMSNEEINFVNELVKKYSVT
jgi:hypothetical protein